MSERIDFDESPRPKRYHIGREAENRVKAFLTLLDFEVLESQGRDGEPDVLFKGESGSLYAAEVKSIKPWVLSDKSNNLGYQVSGLRLSYDEFLGVESWAQEEGVKEFFVIVETRIRASAQGNIYFFLDAETIHKLNKSAKNWIYVSFYSLPLLSCFVWRPGLNSINLFSYPEKSPISKDLMYSELREELKNE